jgi:hypothetical protein
MAAAGERSGVRVLCVISLGRCELAALMVDWGALHSRTASAPDPTHTHRN